MKKKTKQLLQNMHFSGVEYSPEQRLGKEFGGSELSGGQRQKLAIARCLGKEGQLNILDEPTAAIDPKFESNLYSDLFKQFSEETTVIVITHRLGTVSFVDEVIVLDKGKIVQHGKPNELKNTNGKFKELWDAQSSLYT